MDPFIKAAASHFLRGGVQHLTLFVTHRCNLRCRTCFVDFEALAAHPELTLEEVRSLKTELGRVPMVNIGGGEPFLREDLAESIALFKDAETIGLPTNGWHTEKVLNGLTDILAHIPVSKLGLMISIDGFEATHDHIRVPGSFGRAVETLRAVRAAWPNLAIQVNTVLCEKNVDEVLALTDFIRGFTPSHHSVFLLRGQPRDQDLRLPPLERIRHLLPDLLKKLKAYHYHRPWLLAHVARNYHAYMLDLSLRILEQRKQLIPCLAGRASLVVYSNGEAAPCELLPPVGNIRDQGLTALMSGAAWQAAVADIRQGCCHCTHNCNMNENILFNSRNYLRLLGLPLGGF